MSELFAINTNAVSRQLTQSQFRSPTDPSQERIMQIFRTNRIIFGWLGIFESNDFKVKLFYCTCLVSPILLLFPSIAYSVANISDVSKATSAFYITCVITMTQSKYMAYLYHKSLIRSILNDFESIIDCSE